MGSSNRVCPNCNRKMKQQFVGLMHCKCGLSWSKQDGYFERTTDMKFCLERRKVGKKVKHFPVIRFNPNVTSKPVMKSHPAILDNTGSEQDDRFYFIAGYTSGGAPYGVTWEEMGMDCFDDEAEDDELFF